MKHKILLMTLAMATVALAASAPADVNWLIRFNIQEYQQTAPSNISLIGYFMDESVQTPNQNDVSNVTITRPNGSVDTLSESDAGSYWSWLAFSNTYGTLADYRNAFPLGGYEFSADTSGGPIDTTLTDTGSIGWTNNTMVTNYNDLVNYNVGSNLTVDWTGFTPDPNATYGLTFVNVIDTNTGQIVLDGAGDNTMDLFIIGANALQAGTQYDFQIYQSNRLEFSPDPNFGNGIPLITEDALTDVYFTPQAVPEPSSIASLVGLLGLLAIAKKRRQS